MSIYDDRHLIQTIKKGAGTGTIDGATFDSTLDIGAMNGSTNADLIVTLKLHFVPVTAKELPDADQQMFDLLNWGQPDPDTGETLHFNEWVQSAVAKVSPFWNEKLWLKTPDSYAALDTPLPGATASARPNIHCGFRCAATGPDEAHMVVYVARVWRKKNSLANGSDTASSFRSNMRLWDSRDLEYERFGSYGHMTAAHEVVLGLNHIGQGAGGCSAKYSAYEGANGELAPNIMGKGDRIGSANALPWQRRMAAHTRGKTKPEDWLPWNSRWVPRPLRGGKL